MILMQDYNNELSDLYSVPDYPFECLIYDGAITQQEVQQKVIEIFLSIIKAIQELKEKIGCNFITINIY